MHKKGPLLIKYYIEENEDLRNKVLHMLKMDQKAQLLMGDCLRQDQFKFFYDTCKFIYDSALRGRMLDEKNADNKVLEEVVPKLIAYKAIMIIRDI
jgi:hypothetical protein